MPSNKKRVYIALYHRDQESLGNRRQMHGAGAYHWAILIAPKKESGRVAWAFDVTNGVKLSDTKPRRDLNPYGLFWYRASRNINRTASSALLCVSMIGKLEPGVTFEQIRDLLSMVPIPRHGTHFNENCVTWTVAAIRALIAQGYADNVPLPTMISKCLSSADAQMYWLHNGSGRWQQAMQNLTSRPM